MPHEQERTFSPSRKMPQMHNENIYLRMLHPPSGGGGSVSQNYSEVGLQQQLSGRLYSVPPGVGYAMNQTAVYDMQTAVAPSHHQTSATLHIGGSLPSAGQPPAKILHTGQLSAAAVPQGTQSMVHLQSWLQSLQQQHQQQTVQEHPSVVQTAGGGGDAATQQQQQQQHFQRLKVEDALSYLDKVKLQFGSVPSVYNDFLDIMKEFKSQHIDTPGVIKRVSTLFRGHSDLIVGFNTFLPPGFKIEVQPNDVISFHQPGQGIISLSSLGAVTVTGGAGGVGGAVKLAHSGGIPQPIMRHLTTETAVQLQPHQQGIPQVQQLQQGTVAGQPVEFNHAIHYVNKIKSRYHGKPEVYKAFLDILHTYQKEQKNIKEGLQPNTKPLTEAEVYARVTSLFKDQPDLLSEFGQFLPDANGSPGLMSGLGSADWSLGGLRGNEYPSMPVGGSKSSMSVPPASLAVPSSHKSSARSPLVHHRTMTSNHGSQPNKKIKLEPTTSEPDEQLRDLAFFEKVRQKLNNDASYTQLIKCINLFNQKIVSEQELMTVIQPLHFHVPELKKRIRRMLRLRNRSSAMSASGDRQRLDGGLSAVAHLGRRVDDMSSGAARINRPRRVPVVTPGSSQPVLECDLSTCEKYGPSYRILPASYPHPKCSGRIEDCPEIQELNDQYVSFACQLDDDDSSQPTTKRNQFEDHVSQCEDERYELDMVIDSNISAMNALTSLQTRISFMSSDDQAKYRLDDTLGGISEPLIRAALERLYGDKVADVMLGLKLNPHAVLPIVLRRMNEKCVEWQAAKNLFNRTWREQMDKYYLKSLDFQGTKFKQADVKMMRSKALVKDIEVIAEEQNKKSGNNDESAHVTLEGQYHDVMDDALSLLVHNIGRQAGIQHEDRLKIKRVLFRFIPDLFMIPCSADSSDLDMASEDGAEGTDSADDSNKDTKKCLVDVIKPVLPYGPTSSEETMEVDEASDNATILADAVRTFLANDNWYCFLRYLMLLCDRVQHFRRHAQRLADEEAQNVNLRSEHAAVALQLRLPGAVAPSECYTHFLEMVRSLMDGNVDAASFEDQMREIFTINAYLSFTIDKLILNIVKQLQYLVSKEECIKLMQLYFDNKKNTAESVATSCAKSTSTAASLANTTVAAVTSTAVPASTVAPSVIAAPSETPEASSYEEIVKLMLTDENCYRINVNKMRGIDWKLEVTLLNPVSDSDHSPENDESELNNESVCPRLSANALSGREGKTKVPSKPVFLDRNRRCLNMSQAGLDRRLLNSSDSGEDFFSSLMNTMPNSITNNDSVERRIESVKILSVQNYERISLYKFGSLTRTRQKQKSLSVRKYIRFSRWLESWRRSHVSAAQMETCTRWLLGKVEGLKVGTTRHDLVTADDRAPFRVFTKYSVISAEVNSEEQELRPEMMNTSDDPLDTKPDI